MQKIGQVSVYIFMALVLLIIFGFFYSLSNRNKETNLNLEDSSISFSPVENYVQECLKQTASKAIELIELQGGYNMVYGDYLIVSGANYEHKNISFDWIDIPYYIKNNTINMPVLYEIEQSLSDYINENINNCFDNFSIFKNQDFQFDSIDYSTITTINQNEITFELVFPTKITYKGSTKVFENFIFNQKSDLSKLFESSFDIVQAHKDKSDLICVTCIADIAYKNNQLVKFTPLNDNKTVIITVSNKKENPELFNFAFEASI